MTAYRNRVKVTTATTGTGTVTSSTAVVGYQTAAAATPALVTGDVVTVLIEDVSNAWEISQSTYNSSGPTWTRTLIESSTGSLLNLSGAATLSVVEEAGDIISAPPTPQGRLTLVTGTPVMSSDQTAKTTVYYTPYVGSIVPIYSGTAWKSRTFAELSMALDTSNQLSGSVYDLFVWSNAGVISIGAGPAWSSTTSRGTGAGTTQLTLLNGIWVNTVSITLKNGAGGGTAGVAANTATYVGTLYCTANGQTGMAFQPSAAAGGTNNILGLYNAYNRVMVRAQSRDNTASWTLNSATLRATNGSNSNRISWVDGLQQSQVKAEVLSFFVGLAWTGGALDSTSTTNLITQTTAGASGFSSLVSDTVQGQLGFHFYSGIEATSGSVTFNGSRTSPTGQFQMVQLELMM